MKKVVVLVLFISLGCTRYNNDSSTMSNYRNDEPPQSFEERLENARQRNCTDGAADPGIIGGTKLSSYSRIAAGMVILFDSRLSTACTGVLVSSDVILTAAHCLIDSQASDVMVGFTTDFLCDWGNERMERFSYGSSKKVHPQYRRLEGATTLDEQASRVGYDVALLKLQSKAPWSSSPLHIAADQVEWPQEKQIYLVGYGRILDQRFEDNSDPMLRAVAVQYSAEAQSLWDQDADMKGYFKDLAFFDSRQGRGACSGDSGGPVLIRRGGDYLVAGTASFVSPSDCTGFVAYTELHNLKYWLREAHHSLSKETNPF